MEQNVEWALRLADRAVIIDQGEVVHQSSAAALLADKDIQERYPQVIIGSYPFESPQGFATNLVLRSRDDEALASALNDVQLMAAELTRSGKVRGWS